MIAGMGVGGSGGSDFIATEVQILNSSSVLLPVFEAVKAQKPPEQAKAMRFQDWAQSAITAEDEKGTSVLNVEFRDTNEQLVLPLARMISQAYQSYSHRGRSRDLGRLMGPRPAEGVLQELRDEHPRAYLLASSIAPFGAGELPLAAYTGTLALATLQEHSDAVLLFDNASLMSRLRDTAAAAAAAAIIVIIVIVIATATAAAALRRVALESPLGLTPLLL